MPLCFGCSLILQPGCEGPFPHLVHSFGWHTRVHRFDPPPTAAGELIRAATINFKIDESRAPPPAFSPAARRQYA